MGYVKWSYDTLNTFCHDVFRKFGFNEEETNIIKDVLLTADLYGIESHGMQRMVKELRREPSIRMRNLRSYLRHLYQQ